NSSDDEIEKIEVIYQKTQESLQKVPLSVSALTSEDMRKRNIRELEDVALATSAFSFEDFGGGFGVPVIRGGAQTRIQDLDMTTSVFLDGIYLPRQYMFDIGTVGFDRIEVVKGPQSALYGKNAFLGAVNYVSKRPGDELSADASATLGSDKLREFTGEVSVPIIEDFLSARVVVAHSEFDGSWQNDHPDADLDFGSKSTKGNVGGHEKLTYGLNVDITPNEKLNIELDYYRVERFAETGANNRVEAPGDTNCSPTFFGGNRFYCGEIPDTFTPLPGGSPEGSIIVRDPRSYSLDVVSDFFRARVDYEISDAWGLMYQYGNSDSETTSAGGGDRDPLLGNTSFGANIINGTPVGTVNFFSHELQMQYSHEQWSGFVGVFTSEIDDFDKFDLGIAPLRGTEPIIVDATDGILSGTTSNIGLTNAATDVLTDAIFGQISWTTEDGSLRITAEGRYSDEEKVLDSNTTTEADTIFSANWTEFTPRFSVDYQLDDDRMVYASLARGAKSGGFNNTVFDESQRSFEPDENWTTEVGSKNDLLNGKLRLNGALFYTNWNDLQIASSPIGIPAGVTPPAIVDNTGGASIFGFELDGAWTATDNLSIDFAVSKSKTEYKDGSKSSRIGLIGGCDGIVCPADGSIGGNQLQRQPEFQASVGVELAGELSGGYYWSVRGDVNHQSKQFIDELNLAWLPDRTLVNLRANMQMGEFDVSLWAKNVFDKEYAASSFFIATPFGTAYVPIRGQKRTVGLTVAYSF
ncbi:MAG: iron complex outermembrane receptor protein, partial [Gammaproteobacteria bacterium]